MVVHFYGNNTQPIEHILALPPQSFWFTLSKITLGYTVRTTCRRGDDLGTLPRVVHIAVVVKVVNRIGALKYYNLKIAVGLPILL